MLNLLIEHIPFHTEHHGCCKPSSKFGKIQILLPKIRQNTDFFLECQRLSPCIVLIHTDFFLKILIFLVIYTDFVWDHSGRSEYCCTCSTGTWKTFKSASVECRLISFPATEPHHQTDVAWIWQKLSHPEHSPFQARLKVLIFLMSFMWHKWLRST